jgi:hypothetical protein
MQVWSWIVNSPKQLKEKLIKGFNFFENGVNDESVIHRGREQNL